MSSEAAVVVLSSFVKAGANSSSIVVVALSVSVVAAVAVVVVSSVTAVVESSVATIVVPDVVTVVVSVPAIEVVFCGPCRSCCCCRC